MRYFLLEADKGNPQPRFLDWYNEMHPRKQATGDIPRLNSLRVALRAEVDLLDIVSYPYFMICKDFAELVRQYDETIRFRYVVLYDGENRRHRTYGMPLLEVVDCLAEQSERSRDHSVLKRGVLRREAVAGRTLFQIGGVKNRYVAASLELVESAYRREVQGLHVRELDMV